MITKSGGNTFSGSFRSNFSNNAWTVETPREKAAGTERPRQAESELRSDPRRTDHARPAVVLRRGPLAGHEQHPRRSPETNLPFDDDDQGHALRGQRHRDDRARAHAPGELHPRHDRPDAAAVRGRRSTRTSPSTRASRTGCSSRATTACLNTKLLANFQVSQKKEGLPRQRRLRHRHPRLSVLHAWRRRRACPAGCTTTATTSTLPTRKTATTSSTPAASRTSLTTPQGRVARHQGRVRALQVEPDRRQLAERERLCVRHATTCRVPSGPGIRRERPDHPDVRARSDAARELARDARRQPRYPHAVLLPAGQLDARTAPDAEPGRPARDASRARRPAGSSASTRAPRCRVWRPPTICPDTAARCSRRRSRTIRGSTTRRRSAATLRSRNPGGGASTTTRARRARAATSRRDSTSRTTRSSSGRSRRRTSSSTRACRRRSRASSARRWASRSASAAWRS